MEKRKVLAARCQEIMLKMLINNSLNKWNSHTVDHRLQSWHRMGMNQLENKTSALGMGSWSNTCETEKQQLDQNWRSLKPCEQNIKSMAWQRSAWASFASSAPTWPQPRAYQGLQCECTRHHCHLKTTSVLQREIPAVARDGVFEVTADVQKQ